MVNIDSADDAYLPNIIYARDSALTAAAARRTHEMTGFWCNDRGDPRSRIELGRRTRRPHLALPPQFCTGLTD